jgi:BirA family transcriptional regulator, biotin operon repressor / biotin---[acetyl-CoA-carboxylase] ligase
LSTNNNTLFVGKVLLHLKELDSTNAYALNLLSKNKPSEGTVISAWNQTKGRGQIGSEWESEAGKNITISLILYPTFLPIRKQFLLNQAISLSIFDFISRFLNNEVKIKWPNDILVGDKKIAGILIQNILSSNNYQTSIVGLGINVNQISFKNFTPNPTSIILETKIESDLENLISLLCDDIEKRYLQLRANNISIIQQNYLSNLYHFGEDAIYRRMDNEEVFSGKIVGVDESGKLIIDHPKGQSVFSMKEVKFL